VAKWRACVETGENFEFELASTGRMGNIAGCSTASVTPRQATQQLPRQNLVDRLRLTIGRTQLLIVNRPGLLKI